MPASKKERPIIVCDASPLIFLAKLDQLGLIERVSRATEEKDVRYVCSYGKE